MEIIFGEFLKEKRLKKKISLRKFAEEMNVSASFLSDLENGERGAPSGEMLKNISIGLALSKNDDAILNDLAQKPNEKVTVTNVDVVKVALRVAKDFDATEEEWAYFIRNLQGTGGKLDDKNLQTQSSRRDST